MTTFFPLIINLFIYICAMKIQKIHIGKEIKNIVGKKHSSYADFARSLGKTRQNIHAQIFSKQSLQTDMLIEISEKLGVNLFELFQSEEKSVIQTNDNSPILVNIQINTTEEELKKIGVYDRLMELAKKKLL